MASDVLVQAGGLVADSIRSFPSLILSRGTSDLDVVLHVAPGLGLFLGLVVLECLYLLVIATVLLQARWRGRDASPAGTGGAQRWPRVSCIVTCYGEGVLVQRTLQSLIDQDYPGHLEILPVVDGAVLNRDTLAAARALVPMVGRWPRRHLRILPKWIRGGRSSSLNAGLALAGGSIVMALDGDTSFDRDMVSRVVGRFARPGVVAVAGTLRVRNACAGLLTRLQALDYLVFRHFVRTGLGDLGVVNNIPGAHGAFRRDVLGALGGWDNGTAEDVDLAHRLKCMFGAHPGWRIAVAPDVIGHTDVPARWRDFLRQRLRWEGDPVFLFLRKHRDWMSPRVMGWRNFLFALWYGPVFQILMPPLMLLSLLLLALAPAVQSLAVLAAGYAVYLFVATVLGGLHLLLTSERPRQDAQALLWLPLYPPFIFLLRAWCGVAVLHSLVLRSHRDTSMAPWWVLRKSRFSGEERA